MNATLLPPGSSVLQLQGASVPHTITTGFGRAETRPFRRIASISPAASLVAVLALAPVPRALAQHLYQQTNLVSDVPGLAVSTDSNLVNAWGLSRSATSPWWVADNGTGLSTLYNGAGAKQTLKVTIPPASGSTEAGTPTGTVFNGSADFQVGPGQPARFLFASEEGTISGWNPAASPTTAITKFESSTGAVYKGLALAQLRGANLLYAADFHGGKIDVFDRDFQPVNLGADAFRDAHLPPGYAPFNVQTVGDSLFVTYAKQDADKLDEVAGAGRGFVTAYGPDGALRLRLQWGPWFNAPWGVALAPSQFGRFGGMILVGQFGSGRIAAFDPARGRFRGYLQGADHRRLQIDGLWALAFGNDANAGPATTLYFTAGINDEAHGLFGTITLAPDRGDADQNAADDDAEPGDGQD
ncbi:MAG TPA: TIGR03118 family protein [Lacunisphaera sp.]|nr:TIGR03118 family protein [Lacunisphaera sp.]